jgi:hypothetical protein
MIGRAEEDRAALVAKHGKVWTEDELREEFAVLGTMSPFVTVRRRSDGKLGSVAFAGSPRMYFDFKEDE